MDQNENLLDEVHKSATMGYEAADLILNKLEHCGLRSQVERQSGDYHTLAQKAEKMMNDKGRDPKKETPMSKAMLWGNVQLSTLTDKSPTHIAEMMISGTTMGVIDLTKKLNQLKDADAGARRLAEEYLEGEKEHIDALKQYLC